MGQKYSIVTSRATKHSRGRVVSMLRPKHRRAMFTMRLFGEKLLSTLPWVREPKLRKPARPRRRHAAQEMLVE